MSKLNKILNPTETNRDSVFANQLLYLKKIKTNKLNSLRENRE